MQLTKDFVDLFRLLNAHGVRFLVIGGYAVGFHGYPRGTKDLAVWIANDPENAERVAKALTQFAFPTSGVDPAIFLKPKAMIRMFPPPNTIEILTSISGVAFEDCYPRRVSNSQAGVEIPFIGKSDLLANKRASGRLQDLLDVERLP
jgi:hypothetical protein